MPEILKVFYQAIFLVDDHLSNIGFILLWPAVVAGNPQVVKWHHHSQKGE